MPTPPSKTMQAVLDCGDLLSAYGAGVIADHINAFWRSRGAEVGAERYEIPGGGGWGVRSRLVAGLPRRSGHPGGDVRVYVDGCDPAKIDRHITETIAKMARTNLRSLR